MTNGPHAQILHHPNRRRIHQINSDDYKTFEGSFAQYFEHFISPHREPHPAHSCWRTKEGVPLCSGTRMDTRFLVVSVPLIFSVEVGDEMGTHRDHTWDFPAALPFSRNSLDDNTGLVYDLVGLALTNSERNHFIARYASPDNQIIYTYDDMKHSGAPIQELGATYHSHMCGKDVQLPKGFIIYQVFYLLRGGVRAQDKFVELRTAIFANNFNFEFSETNLDVLPSMKYNSDKLIELPARDRTWLLNPYRAGTREYVMRPHDMTSDLSSLGPESEDEGQPIIQAILEDSTRSESSVPTSLFGLDCRCGIVGDGNLFYPAEEYGDAIQCNDCNNWSHIACQRNGRASNLSDKDKFTCDACNPSYILHPTTRFSKRK